MRDRSHDHRRARSAALVALALLAGGQQLAVHGHPALVLGYFGLPGLPASIDRIAIETVTRGVHWLEQCADGPVALMGGSLGGELALLAAALEPTLTDCVVALVPGSRVSPGEAGKSAWAWRGKPVRPRALIPV